MGSGYRSGMQKNRPYPTDVSDEEWVFAAPCLSLMTGRAPQRKYEPCLMFNALRWMARAGAPWHLLPNDFAGLSTTSALVAGRLLRGDGQRLTLDLAVVQECNG
jgi:hypothetical protein